MDDIERLYNLAGPSQNSRRSLVGRKYSRKKFDRLLFGPGDPFCGGVDVRDCEFVSCSTDTRFAVSHGVHMQSVLFDEVRAPDAMIVSSATVLQNVVVRGGRKAAGLWCNPPLDGDVSEALLEWSRRGMAGVGLAIDLSGLAAPDSEVVGIPLSKLKWNPEIHIPVSTSWESSDCWGELDIPQKSFWRIPISRLRDCNCSEGLFTIPFPGDRGYEAKMEELARIESAGLLKR
ncbi:hypothetical protein ABIA71_003617 [Stenotrophomonas sp. 2619]|uniref:hypothetical protein n=1 Tax=Stenotrophomonas sp. 2619 TaxID=3156316 RepID=UPI00339B7110